MIAPWALGFLLALAGSFLFSGAETGMYTVNRIRLRARAEAGLRAARRVLDLLHEPTLLIAVILVGNNITNYLASLTFLKLMSLVVEPEPDTMFLWNTVILTLVLCVFGEITPKDCFRRRADSWFPGISPVLRPLVRAAGVIRGAAAALLGLPARPRPRPGAVATRREIVLSFEESAEEGALSGDQGRLAVNILALRETRLDALVRPLDRLGRVAETSTVAEAVAAGREAGTTRVLVGPAADPEPVGQLILHELIGVEGSSGVAGYVRPLLRLPGETTAMRALLLLRTERQSLVLVTEGARVAGVVTVKDLAEEVVGELPGW